MGCGSRAPHSAAVLAFNLLLELPPPPPGVAIAVSPEPGRGRSYFLRNQGGMTLAGSFYRPAPGSTEPNVEDADIEAALVVIRRCVPDLPVGRAQVRAVTAGLLPDRDGTGRNLLARDRHLMPIGKGYHMLVSTKLTTAPLLSERLAARLWPRRMPFVAARYDLATCLARRSMRMSISTAPHRRWTISIRHGAPWPVLRRAGHVPVLMLAEQSGSDVFAYLADHLSPCAEPDALWYEADGARMLIVAGRQIVSDEGLEILALACREPIEDGRPASTIVAELSARDALVVLPWGAGKWLGERGRLLGRLLAQEQGGIVAGRQWRTPRLVVCAATRRTRGRYPDRIRCRCGAAPAGSVRSGRSSRRHSRSTIPSATSRPRCRNPATHAASGSGGAVSPVRFAREQLLLRLAR